MNTQRMAVGVLAMVVVTAGMGCATRSGPICWMKPELSALAYRGPDSKLQTPTYNETQMKIFDKMVRRSIEDKYIAIQEKRPDYSWWLMRKPQWKLKSEIQELFNGALSVTVKAYRINEEDKPLYDWSEQYASMSELKNRMDGMGDEIAHDLWGIKLDLPLKP